MTKAILGIIGGSGIYDLPGLENVREEAIASPWGEPSAPVRHGSIAGLPIVFLPRHDKGHRLSPSDINYRANIDVLKRAGVTDLISLSACGSFKEELPPGTFVLVDQFVDRTHKRENSFFGKGCVAHVSMAHPVSPRLRIHLAAAAEAEGIAIARGGTYLCMEGPQFSSYAESMNYKNLGYHHPGIDHQRRQGQGPGGAACQGFPAGARTVSQGFGPRARHRHHHRAGSARSRAFKKARRGGGKDFAGVTRRSAGLMVRDARRCRAPHHEGSALRHKGSNLIQRSARQRASRRMEQ